MSAIDLTPGRKLVIKLAFEQPLQVDEKEVLGDLMADLEEIFDAQDNVIVMTMSMHWEDELAPEAKRSFLDEMLGDVERKMTHTGDPATSKESARLEMRTLSKQLHKHLLEYRNHEEGLTDLEASAAAGYPVDQGYYPRRPSQLRGFGFITPNGATRESRQSGRQRMVCIITQAGRDKLAAMEGQ